MNDPADKALLPAGMRDMLPPEAAFEAQSVERLMASFGAHGYDRVKSPLLEFEENLLTGSGAGLASQTFRLMDPVSQRMMGLRPDTTLQVARIAATRLRNAPRPLRLSYAGQVLRVSGTQLRPERQFGQVGAELIGTDNPDADAEVIVMAVEALQDMGIDDLTVDLGLPQFVPAVCAGLDLDVEQSRNLRQALDRKDAAGVAALGRDPEGRATEASISSEAARTLVAMLEASGPAEQMLVALNGLDLPAAAVAERETLAGVVAQIRKGTPDLALTVDVIENRGFEYHTGVTFTFFAASVRGELGRGGRYRASNETDGGEPATGFTFFMDSVMRALRAPPVARRVLVPGDVSLADLRALHHEDWVTVRTLGTVDCNDAEAKRMNCTHRLATGKIIAVDEN